MERFELFIDPDLAPIIWSAVLIALAAGALSPFVVMNRMAFFSDSIAHSSLLGVALGLVLGVTDLTWTMLGTATVVGVAVSALWWRTRQSIDSLLGVAMAGAMALGFLLYVHYNGYRDLHSFLVGSLPLMPASMFAPIAVGTALVLLTATLMYNSIALLAISRNLAAARRYRVKSLELLLVLMLALVVALGVRAVGVLMMNALLVVPGACARNWCRGLTGFFWVSVVVGGAAAIAGIALSHPSLPPGPSIVMTAVGFFVVSLIFRPRT